MGKSIGALFSSFSKEELCQLYIYPTLPDIDVCSSYYRITDKDVFKGYYKFHVSGQEIRKEDIVEYDPASFKDERFYRNRKNHNAVRLLLRDIMWKFSHWFNKKLKEWIVREKPTHVFVAPGESKFIYDIALKISKKFQLPIIAYICDDYYFVDKSRSLVKRIQLSLLHNKIKKLLSRTSYIVTICSELEEAYKKEFGENIVTIMTGSNYPITDSVKKLQNINSITYMGNIRCNRFNSLVDMGQVLDSINQENGTNYRIDIYSAEKDEGILKLFDDIKSIRLCGFVAGAKFYQTLMSSELLLHVEAFDHKSIDSVKYSVSTKIADSLGSGICLFAYGPDSVASMKYLMRNDCAIVAKSKDELRDKLISAFLSEDLREHKAEQGLVVAETYHNAISTSKKFHSILETVR